MQDPITKPMLASPADDVSSLPFPMGATPKLDGIRCLIIDDESGKARAVSRNFKPIQNAFIRKWLEAHCPIGFDGELMLRDSMNFQAISSAVMKQTGEPDFLYYVFDYVKENRMKPYANRMADLALACHPGFIGGLEERVQVVLPALVKTEEELSAYEETCLAEGYEGVMVRTLSSPYKFGRSSVREAWLLKIKRFADSEAVILEVKAKKHNTNVATQDELGRTRRSSSKAGIEFEELVGGFIVKDCVTGIEFNIGSGLDDATRKSLWAERSSLPGRMIKYKYQPTGVKEAPRFPIFLGFRDAADL